MLTAAQKKRLAKEARKLAMAALDGRAVFGRYYDSSPACALGQLFDGDYDAVIGSVEFEQRYVFACSCREHGAPPSNEYVFPLLALADALDEPRAAPSPTPNTRKER